ncbi:MAG: DUF58 domain-containing protein [Thermoguttaceae bacterium]
MTRKSRITISLEGWYYLLMLAMVCVGAVVGGVNLLLVLAGMLAGPLLFGWWAVSVALRGLQPRRKVPHGVCAGDLLVVNVRLTNTRRKRGCWAVVVEEQIRRTAAAAETLRPRVLFSYVPAGESRDAAYRGRLERRGCYELGPLRLSTRFPFGLFCRTTTVGGTDTLTVFPRLGRLTRVWAARHREALTGTHRRERRHGNEGDFFGVRQWRSGDSRRQIHWRSTARTGQLVVCQLEQPRNRDVVVLVDLRSPEQPGLNDAEHVELAVSFAATVVADLCRKVVGNIYLGTTADPTRLLHGPASAALMREMLDMLAVVEPGSDDRWDELTDQVRSRIDRGTEIVLVGTRKADPADVAQLGSLSGGHLRCIDASSDELSQVFQFE